MRPFEILLLIIDFLAFFSWVIPLPASVRWIRLFAPAALLAAIVQVLVEGSRWQMIPGYVLAGLFCLVWLVQVVAPAGLDAGRLWIRIPLIGLSILLLAIATGLPLAFPVFRIPQPTGPYAIGTLTYYWVDRNRPEIFTAATNDRRELVGQLWYPAVDAPSAPRAPYIPNARALAPLARMIHLPGFFMDQLKYVKTHAIPAAPAAAGPSPDPVLIFSAGRGGFRQESTRMFEELVSHGYIIAAIDSPYASSGVVFPDGRLVTIDPRLLPGPSGGFPADLNFYDTVVVPYLAQDVRFTLDQLAALNQADPNGILTGRMDLQRIGMLGPSLGGLVGAEACYQDPRLKALLAMDVQMPDDVVLGGLQQPTMFISREAQWMKMEGWYPGSIDETQYTIRAVFEHLPGDGYLVLVPGMFHANFSDAAYYSPLMQRLGILGPIDGKRSNRILDAYTLAFFDQYLKGQPAALLDGPSEQFPEVSFALHQAGATPNQNDAERLAGTKWQLVSSGRPGLEKPVLAGSTITLAFDAKGQAAGSAGCNGYGAPYEVQRNRITFGKITRSLMACAQAGVDQQEQQFLQALETLVRYALFEDRLTIWYAGGNEVLNFRKVSAAGMP